MAALESSGGGIEQIVGIAVDFSRSLDDQFGGIGEAWPFDEEMQRRHRIVKGEGMVHCLFFGNDIIEVRQSFQVVAQTVDKEMPFEGCPPYLLCCLYLSGRVEGIDIDVLPIGEAEVIVHTIEP